MLLSEWAAAEKSGESKAQEVKMWEINVHLQNEHELTSSYSLERPVWSCEILF